MNKNSPFKLYAPWRLLLVLLCAGLLVACASSPTPSSSAAASSSRYHMASDAYPDEEVDVSHVVDPVPRWEPKSRGGNKSPYVVWGKTYYVLASAKGYRERGIASWYGKKFHGYETSNGEIYDMYAMSAAHRSLPIPSYAKVTNLANGRSVIVRVNDRGPFHGERLIDLSYAAAKKLGYVDKGTAQVEVEAIHVEPGTNYTPSQAAVAPSSAMGTAGSSAASAQPGAGWFVQVGAFSSLDAANRVRDRVRQAVSAPVVIQPSGETGVTLHRVQVGPFSSEMDAEHTRAAIEAAEAVKALVIQRPLVAG